jgi:hypothetical protein
MAKSPFGDDRVTYPQYTQLIRNSRNGVVPSTCAVDPASKTHETQRSRPHQQMRDLLQ